MTYKSLADLALDLHEVFGNELARRPDRHYLTVMYGRVGEVLDDILSHPDLETRDPRYVPTEAELADAVIPGFTYDFASNAYEPEHPTLADIAVAHGVPLTRLEELIDMPRDIDGFPLAAMTMAEYFAIQAADSLGETIAERTPR
jgi:hypothetical protein